MNKANIDYHLRQIAKHTKDARESLKLGDKISSYHLRAIASHVATIELEQQ
jgi:hypothetical protein